ncbi:MAG: hypothetical protein JEZ07_04500 [Phycisphaerae bacterium]|nr:hypothetical protein [Phycisphaerae bacterium]
MKKTLLILSVLAAMLMVCEMGLAKEKGEKKEKGAKQQVKEKANKVTDAEKQFREKLKDMSPEERKVAMIKKSYETETAQWQEVRKVAVEEKAIKTIAAVDKILAAKKAEMEKKLAMATKIKGENKKKDKKEE